MKILVFTEGTILMHPTCKGLTREGRVQQSRNRMRSIGDYKQYLPISNAVEKIKKWNEQGADIYYLTSRTNRDEIADIQNVLEKHSFPDNHNLLFRKQHEQYNEVAQRLLPDIIVEDDCESIGGEKEMTYPHIKPDLKSKIKSIVVKEFGGIDHLPDNISAFLTA